MKLTRTLLSGLAVASLATAPVVAQDSRSTAPAEETNSLDGGMEGGAWIAILGVIAVVVLAVIAATNDDDEAVSP